MDAAAWAAAAGFVVIAVFQAALALGAPLGLAAWGGTHARPPTRLRIASAFAMIIWTQGAVVVLERAGVTATFVPDVVARWATWILVGVLVVGAVINAASSSPWERFLWAPLAIVLAALCFVIARS